MTGSKRKEVEQAFLTALAYGATVESAARKAGFSERTAYRCLADPDFSRRLEQLRSETVQRIGNGLTGAGLGSVMTLVQLQQDATVNPAVRRRAARDVLELGIRYREAGEVERRLSALEENQIKAA
jgi:hypothetical protein